MKETKSEWSTEERLEELRGKLNLKERDNDAFFWYTQEQIGENDRLIKRLREDVKAKREILANCLNGDREVIITALHESPNDQLTYQRSTADKCIEEKNQDVFDQVKKLNSIKHEQNLYRKRVNELELTLNNLKRQEHDLARTNSRTNDDTSDQRTRILSTRLDKCMLKITSARYVNTTYKRLLAYLEKDSLSLPGRLDEVEAILEQQKTELSELRTIHCEARIACDSTRVQRGGLEKQIMNDKFVRDRKLTQVRRNQKQLQEAAEAFNVTGVIKPRTNDGTQKRTRQSAFTPARHIQKEALSHALNLLQGTVGASKVEDIAENFQCQLSRQEALLEEAEKLQAQREKLMAKVQKAEKLLHATTYNGSMDLIKSHQPEDVLQDKDNDLVFAHKHEEARLDMINRYISIVRNALDVFYKKACILDGALSKEEIQDEQKFTAVSSKFSNLAKMSKANLLAESGSNELCEDMVQKMLKGHNRRIEMPVEDDDIIPSTQRNGAETDEDDDQIFETNYCSRDEIKKKSENLINLAKPKKKQR